MPTLNYETNDGVTGRTRISGKDGFLAAYGAEPVGPPSSGFYVRKSGSKRQKGIQARSILLRREDGPLTPAGQQPYLFKRATVGSPAAFAAFAEGQVLTFDGDDFEIYAKSQEG